MKIENESGSKEYYLGLILVSIALIYLIISTYMGIMKVNMWYDEIFSLNMANISINSLITLGSNNVHPLLYYIILKIFVKIFQIFNYTNLEIIGVIVSLIPFYLIFGLNITKIKKNFGILTAGLFSLCVISMPQLLRYSIEVRMYGWALLFLLVSYVYIYEISKEPTLKNWIILTVLTICSSYTHYFSAVTSFCLYLIFLIYIVFEKKELLKGWVISSIICICAYIPWIPSLLYQITNVHNSYWIDPITFNTIISYVYYVFSPLSYYIDGNSIISPNIIGTILLICFIYLMVYYLKNQKLGKYPIYGLIAIILVPFIGIIISILYSPIFFMRYLIPVLGIFWLIFSIFLDNIKEKKKIFTIILAIIIIVGFINLIYFINTENANFNKENEMKSFYYDNIPPNSIIIYDGFNSFIESTIFDSEKNYTNLYNENLEKIWKPEQDWKKSPENYLDTLLTNEKMKEKSNKRIFIVDTNNKYSNLKEYGYDLTKIRKYENKQIYELHLN